MNVFWPVPGRFFPGNDAPWPKGHALRVTVFFSIDVMIFSVVDWTFLPYMWYSKIRYCAVMFALYSCVLSRQVWLDRILSVNNRRGMDVDRVKW